MNEESSIDLNRLERIGKTAIAYYNQAPFNPSHSDFIQWIESLREPMKSDFQKQGLDKCKGILNFKRFILELKDYGMTDYMRDNLSKEDFEFWNSPE